MKGSITVTLLSIIVLIAGCSSPQPEVKYYPAPTFLNNETKHSETMMVRDNVRSGMVATTKRDSTAIHGLYVVAKEGQETGYKYFAIVYPPELNNIRGSSITSIDEFDELCLNNGIRHFINLEPQCSMWIGKSTASFFHVVYFSERPEKFLVWNIEEVLKNEEVAELNEEVYTPIRTVSKQ